MIDELTIHEREPRQLRILQLTDTHIFESAGEDFDGLNTSASLASVIEQVKNAGTDLDLVLVTGDLVHEPGQLAYAKLKSQLQQFETPVVCLPGNHDEPGMMRDLLNDENVSTSRLIRCSHWLIVLLDTSVEGSHGGRLPNKELEFLEQVLKANRQHVLIALHHHPVNIHSTWMDGMMLENGEEFFAVIDAYKQVKGIIWGHIHQEFRQERNSVQLYGSPSTCVQFKPGSDKYQRDSLPAGFSLLELSATGACEIQTNYISDVS